MNFLTKNIAGRNENGEDKRTFCFSITISTKELWNFNLSPLQVRQGKRYKFCKNKIYDKVPILESCKPMKSWKIVLPSLPVFLNLYSLFLFLIYIRSWIVAPACLVFFLI